MSRDENQEIIEKLQALCYRAANTITDLVRRGYFPDGYRPSIHGELMAAARSIYTGREIKNIHHTHFIDERTGASIPKDAYPEYIERVKRGMAQSIGDFLLDNNLLEVEYLDDPIGKSLELSCIVIAPRKEKTDE